PSIRLKKMPIIGWITAGFFQGYFTFLMLIVGVAGFSLPELLTAEVQLPAVLSSLLLWGSYPMTQVYQHEEDASRGDHTISIKLGVLGTFHFTAVMFSLSNAGFLYYYFTYFGLTTTMMFQAFLLPMLIYFFWWYFKVRADNTQANFDYTMKLNMLSAVMLNGFFLVVTMMS
ncbi:MAG: UbiA family prenyltransferase, partial [Bacteroidota bacterium]